MKKKSSISGGWIGGNYSAVRSYYFSSEKTVFKMVLSRWKKNELKT